MKTVNKKGGFFVKNSGPKKQFHNDKPKFKSRDNQKGVKLQKFERTSAGDFFIQSKKDETSPSTSAGTQKRTFDKKRYRLQKYSQKYRLEQYEDKRKKQVLREYYKQIDGDKPKFDVQKMYAEAEEEESRDDKEVNDNENNLNSDMTRNEEIGTGSGARLNKKQRAFNRARAEFERIKQEKKNKREEFEKKKAEKEEKLKEYKKKKTEKFKKLSKKTKKGQPIMKDRMEMLLEEIQNNLNK